MAVRRDRRGWVVDFVMTYPDGSKERVRKLFTAVRSKREAEGYERDLHDLKLKQWRLGPQPERKEVPPLKEFATEFLDTYVRSNNKPSEAKSKKAILDRYLLPALGDHRLDTITVRDVEGLKADLFGKDLSPKTVRNALAVLSKILRYAEEVELLASVPRVRFPRVPKPDFDFLTFEEADRLVAAAATAPEWRPMVFTALRTGLRYGELCELRWSDVDLVAGRLMVRRSFTRAHVTTPKSGKAREVPLSPETVLVLKRYRHLRGPLVFCKPDGGRRIHRRADVAIKKICKRAGLRPIGWHVLRHTFASHLAMRGRPVKEIQELLGHSDIGQTMRYAHLMPSIKRDAVAALDDAPPTCGNPYGNARSPDRQPGVKKG